MKAAEIVYLGLGSNLGERQSQLAAAVAALDRLPQTKVLASSSWLENPAAEAAGPGDFLNGVVRLETRLEPEALLVLLKELEFAIDPERNQRGRKLARKLDIDILLFGDRVINSALLQVPHPRMFGRSFVMQPLLELAPELKEKFSERISAS